MISRKEFLKQSAYLAAGSTWVAKLGSRFTGSLDGASITILYTNDTHSRLDPFPANAREFSGLGGIAKRSALVNKIRAEENNLLLLDAGDVFQGTPWFDVYGGKVDFELMSEMGYDAMAIGNHEFDLGLEGFAEAAQFAEFPFLAANYSTLKTPINPFVERQIIKEFEGFKIGIFGLGIQFDGIVDPSLHKGVRHRDPVIISKRVIESLREFHQCDYVICLSHLGYQYVDSGRIDDVTLARSVPGIDLIIGGHTHTFLEEPVFVQNPGGSHTLITQMGHSGVRLGRIDLRITDQFKKPAISSRYYTVGERI